MLSISCDSIHSHAAWSEQLGGITFPMLSDWHPKGRVSTLYGVYDPASGTAVRSIFVIDGDGIIRWKQLYRPGEGLPDAGELLTELDKVAAAEDSEPQP